MINGDHSALSLLSRIPSSQVKMMTMTRYTTDDAQQREHIVVGLGG